MTARWKAHKGKAFLRQLTAQRVHTFLQKETAVSARFWTEDLSHVRRTWWPLHYRNLQPGLSLSFQSWILVNFTTYGAWPPVTYLTYLTGPTQAFRGQCINKSLFKFIVIYLCKTYSSTLRRTWWPLHYRNLQPWLRLSFPSHASWNTNQTTDCVALFNLQISSIFSSKQKKMQCPAGILKTFIFASTTGLATVFVPLGRKAFVVLSSSSTES